VVARRDLAASAEGTHPGQHPVSQVRVQADTLKLGIGEPARLVPDRVGDPKPAEVVNETRAPDNAHVIGGQTRRARRLARQVSHPP
jgi:hypothetical protein